MPGRPGRRSGGGWPCWPWLTAVSCAQLSPTPRSVAPRRVPGIGEVGVFTPREVANASNRPFPFLSLLLCFCFFELNLQAQTWFAQVWIHSLDDGPGPGRSGQGHSQVTWAGPRLPPLQGAQFRFSRRTDERGQGTWASSCHCFSSGVTPTPPLHLDISAAGNPH